MTAPIRRWRAPCWPGRCGTPRFGGPASTAQDMGRTAAVIATAIFALLPVVLAHGALATTDMAGTAGFALAMAAFQWWLARTSWPRTALMALALGFGLVT